MKQPEEKIPFGLAGCSAFARTAPRPGIFPFLVARLLFVGDGLSPVSIGSARHGDGEN
jgi:hypothetical protein